MKKSCSVLRHVTEAHVNTSPYAHIHKEGALPPFIYEKLDTTFPNLLSDGLNSPDGAYRKRANRNNTLLHLPGLAAIAEGFVPSKVVQDFIAYHSSKRFFREVIKLLGPGIRTTFPDLETKLGKNLEELSVQPREQEGDADVRLAVQFAINTPVREPSKVRARHIDSPSKLFSALLYMRDEVDDVEGGDLEICRWNGDKKFRNTYVEGKDVSSTHINDDQSECVSIIPYEANSLIMFVNSVDAIHGVTERQPTPHCRRYINFIAELKEPIYDLRDYS